MSKPPFSLPPKCKACPKTALYVPLLGIRDVRGKALLKTLVRDSPVCHVHAKHIIDNVAELVTDHLWNTVVLECKKDDVLAEPDKTKTMCVMLPWRPQYTR